MADFVDSLTDSELRAHLVEYGLPVMPITPTTRNTLTRKLKTLIENKSKANAKERKSLSQLSSGEESDNDRAAKNGKRENRRVTIASTMPPPTLHDSGKTVTTTTTLNDKLPSANKPLTPARTNRRTLAASVASEEFSDSDVDGVGSTTNKYISREKRVSMASTNTPTSASSSVTPHVSTPYPRGPLRPRSTNQPELTHNRPFRSSLLGDNGSSRMSTGASVSSSDYKLSLKNDDNVNAETTPFLSDFTRRLSQLRHSGVRSIPNYRDGLVKESENDTLERQTYGAYSKTTLRGLGVTKPAPVAATDYNRTASSTNFVSHFLVGLALVFFVGLFVAYHVYVRDKTIAPDAVDFSLWPLHDPTDLLSKPGVNCVRKDHLNDALAIADILEPELKRKAELLNCRRGATRSDGVPLLTNVQAIEYIKAHGQYSDEADAVTHLYNLQVMLVAKPNYRGLSVVDVKDIKTDDFHVVDDLDALSNRQEKKLAIAMTELHLPLLCAAYWKIYSACNVIIYAIGGLIAIYALYSIMKVYRKHKQDKERHMYTMVERIIDVLSSQHTDDASDEQPFLAINHVRDLLIEPQERQKMAPVWERAKKFIDENESRVRTEVQVVSGEQCPVWRWLGSSNLNASLSRSKVWQGQAFETDEGSVNSLPVSPTQCLKIRQMCDQNSDKGPNWTKEIKDAILEKCGEECKILHIGIDKVTCCIYMKCASQHDAGIAYKNLHGWWFDGKLVTVKYLRLERYSERFPESPSNGPYLKPSSKKAT